MRISESKIEEIRNSANIVDIISEYVSLIKRGKNFVGLCPFHKEKTPSFTVSEDKQIYYCFGCHAGGNVFKFLMDFHKMSFIEAVEELAEKLGIQLELEDSSTPFNSEKEILYNINVEVAKYYANNLISAPDSFEARQYFESRKINTRTIRAFRLGYALPNSNILIKVLKEKKIDLEKVIQLGILGKNKDGSLYDRFSNRIIFPILSPNGRIIAFAGRTLNDKTNSPKYINSPESKIYVKGKVLYGLSHTKNDIRKANNVILVEGYTDLISLYQNEIMNVVAVSGTALTEEQLQLLSRYTKNVILLFDADTAGINASLRSIELLLKNDFEVKIATLPSGEDPDSYVNKFGKDNFLKIIDSAINFFEYQSHYFEKLGYFNDAQKTVEAIRYIVKSLAFIDDELKRTILLKSISKKFNLRENLLETELDNTLKQQSKLEKKSTTPTLEKSEVEDFPKKKEESGFLSVQSKTEKEIIKFLFSGDENILKLFFNNINPESITNEFYKNIFYKVLDYYEHYHVYNPANLISLFDESTQKLLGELTLQEYSISNIWDEIGRISDNDKLNILYIKDLIAKYKRLLIEKEITEIQSKIKSTADNDLIRSLLMKISQLQKEKSAILIEE